MTAAIALQYRDVLVSNPALFVLIAAIAIVAELAAAYWIGLLPGSGLHPVTELQRLSLIGLGLALIILMRAEFRSEWFALLVAQSVIIFVFAAWLIRTLLRGRLAKTEWWGERAIVIGMTRSVAATHDAMNAYRRQGLRVVDVISLSNAANESPEVLLARVRDAARQHQATWMVMSPEALGLSPSVEFLAAAMACKNVLLLTMLPGCAPGLQRKAFPLLGYDGRHVRNEAMHGPSCLVKRTSDLVGAMLLLVLLAPVFLFLIVLVALTSRGPIFYGQRRIGHRGKKIRVWKFRTMVIDADERLAALLQSDPEARVEWDERHKLRHDPRITVIGNWLRRTSLDELPQIWNVFTGSMSFVGPRPIVDGEVERYGPWFLYYTAMRPGITGLWQVSGRDDTVYAERVRLDAVYAVSWSPWLDLAICLRTILTLVRREGAH
ncbi:MAG: exopolysaccharide biosynthesis polyprenyl glycosylphosphotransferase [Planctomycetota bacterium]